MRTNPEGNGGDDGNGGNGRGRGVGLPPAIAAAWGLGQEPGKGPKRGFTVEQIVRVAVRVAVEEGIAAVSMNRVAARLGTTGMSLYRYFSGKEELLDLMVDHAFGPVPPPPGADEGWRTALRAWASGQLAVLRRHPWILDAPIGGPPVTPNMVSWFEHGLRCLSTTLLSEGEKVLVIELVTSLIRSAATLEVQAAGAVGTSRYGGMPADLSVLVEVIDEDRFPALSRLLAASVLGPEQDGPGGQVSGADHDFEFGLDRILDGVQVFMRVSADRGPAGAG